MWIDLLEKYEIFSIQTDSFKRDKFNSVNLNLANKLIHKILNC